MHTHPQTEGNFPQWAQGRRSAKEKRRRSTNLRASALKRLLLCGIMLFCCNMVFAQSLPAITGTGTVCAASTTALSNATTGGHWSSNNASIASVDSASGVVTGMAAGTARISYTVSSSSVYTVVTVNATSAGTIYGTASVCSGSAITLNDAVTGGVWSSNDTSVARVSSTGIVTGVSGGTTTIVYMVGGTCGIATATKPVTVIASPAAGTIIGASSVVGGSTIALSNTVSGGTWSASNTHATVSSAGVVTGVSVGTLNISYTVTNSCGTARAIKAITVLSPVDGITGTLSFCAGATSMLSNTTPGGSWSSNNTAIATVSAGGVVTGVAAGMATVTYATSLGYSTTVVTVNTTPTAITGTTSLCAGATSTLTSSPNGSGAWTSSDTTIARVGVTSRVLTGVSAGTTTVSYTLPSGCRSIAVVNINGVPGAITGTKSVCPGATTALANSMTGGSWSSASATVATVSSTGVVTGVASGTTNITYLMGSGCKTSTTVTVTAIPAAISGTKSVCAGATTNLTTTPAGGSWISSNASIATVGTTGIVTGMAAGYADITYTSATGCSRSATVTVNEIPVISGVSNVCPGATMALGSSVTGGAWSGGNTSIATISAGVVSGVGAGSTNVTYTATTGCKATAMVSVHPLPAAITGTLKACPGTSTVLSDATTGGVWTGGSTSIATIDGSGNVSGIAPGTVTVSYTSAIGCVRTANVVINPTPAPITGTLGVCVGANTMLSDTTLGLTWTSGNTAVATIASNGMAHGVSAGNAIITYKSTSTNCFVTAEVSVNGLPATIGGPASVCAGSYIALTDTTLGGVWSSANAAIATVDSTTGLVGGVSSGSVAISYTVGGCGVSKVVAVNAGPVVGTFSGTPSVCKGSTTGLTNTVTGGAWSSSDTSVARVNSTGVITGVAVGTAFVSYTLTGGCGSSTATQMIVVNSLTDAGSVAGATSVCAGDQTVFSNIVSGGLWTSSNTTVATVDTFGTVSGVAAGTATISYRVTGGCGIATATKAIIVNPHTSAGVITGTASVCAGDTTNLNNAISGGSWSSDNTAVADVNGIGMLVGISAGTATITYSVTGTCGDAMATKVATVNAIPTVGAITATSTTIVAGSTTTLSNPVTGGVWSGSNSRASVNTAGVVTGLSAGTATISYTVATSCGSAVATQVITVTSAVDGIIGTLSLCNGATTALFNTTPGGSWSSNNTAVATIATDGTVTGVAAGMATISYVTSLGYVTAVVTVNTTPSAITGTMTLCAGATSTLSSSPASGGAWTSSDTLVARVGSSSRILTGVSAGIATVTFTLGSGCSTTADVTINELPGVITGTTNVCPGATTALANGTSGGSWSTNASIAIATVDAFSGVVTGVGAGIANITYMLPTGCKTNTNVTVNSLPATITGVASVCAGNTTNLSTTTLGGAWSSSDPATAPISTTGSVSGLLAGTADMTYTSAAGCPRTVTVTVNANPAITGSVSVCPGSTAVLTGTPSGGTWTGGSTSVATVGTTSGVVTGVAAGTTNVTYILSNGCRASATAAVVASPAAITGTLKACIGGNTTLNSTTSGGAWSTDDGTIASVDATGVVSGVAAGTTIVTYSTGSGCYRTAIYTVNAAPAAIGGTLAVCAGGTTTLTDVTPGLSWTSGNTAVATIASSGVVVGVSTGTAIITYTAATNCTTTAVVAVNGAPATIGGPATGCTNSPITLTNTVLGGTWSSSNPAIATVDASGVVSGVTTGAVTITYSGGVGCYKTKAISITTPPTITGFNTACVGTSTTLTGGSGTWSSSTPSVAIVASTAGYVTGASAGTATITFTQSSTGCPATYVVTVIPVPSAIVGATSGCQGSVTTLSNTTAGGSWTSSNTAIASIGSATGAVTAVGSGGTATISYSIGTNCRVTSSFTAKAMPAAIGGTTSLCMPSTTTLTDVTAAGTWSSSNSAIATVGTAINAGTGIVAGVSTGIANITYTITSTGCARSVAVAVNVAPSAGTITSTGGFALNTVTAPTSVTLSSTGAAGGSWISNNPAVATIDASGVVTAVAAGTTTIIYSVSSGSCTNIAAKVITVTAGRSAGGLQTAISNVQLYPNPTTGAFTLASEEAGTLSVYGIDGREVSGFEIKAGMNALNLPATLASGMYMCKFTSESGNTTMVRLSYER